MTTVDVEVFFAGNLDVEVIFAGEKGQEHEPLQHLGLGDQSDTHAQISPLLVSLQPKIAFWFLPYPVGPFPVPASGFIGGSVSRFTRVSA